jgi:hypothetical protein
MAYDLEGLGVGTGKISKCANALVSPDKHKPDVVNQKTFLDFRGRFFDYSLSIQGISLNKDYFLKHSIWQRSD